MAELGIGSLSKSPVGDLAKGIKITMSDNDAVVSFQYDQAQLEQGITTVQGMSGL
jgi:hypothetical protein